jgi:hypothetical protein
MRDITKSALGFSWSMSLFGLQQMSNALMRPGGGGCAPAAESTETVTRAMEEQLDGVMKRLFKTGDRFQRGVVDMMFGMMRQPAAATESQAGSGAGWGCAPCGSDDRPGPRSHDAGGSEAPGWGPMPAEPGMPGPLPDGFEG